MQRFLEKIHAEPMSGCWLWIGASAKSGYGNFFLDGKTHSAHRASYKIFKGEIPHGKVVRHSCDNKACANPDHLSIGTYAENSRDAVERKRFPAQQQSHCKNGHSLEHAPLHSRGNGRMRRVCLQCSRAAGKRYYGRNSTKRAASS
jgi:hypothetical protein